MATYKADIHNCNRSVAGAHSSSPVHEFKAAVSVALQTTN